MPVETYISINGEPFIRTNKIVFEFISPEGAKTQFKMDVNTLENMYNKLNPPTVTEEEAPNVEAEEAGSIS